MTVTWLGRGEGRFTPSGTRHFAEPQPPLSWMKQE